MEASELERLTVDAGAELINLSTVDARARASAWIEKAPSFFPGLSVRRVDDHASSGNVRRLMMGGGSLWTVRSPSSEVSYLPARGLDTQGISLIMQRTGRSTLSQQRRSCELGEGDLCVLDEQFPFTMEGERSGEFIFLRMPRLNVLRRIPHLEHHTALALSASEPSVSLIGHALTGVAMTAPVLRETQRRAALVAMIELLATIESFAGEVPGSAWWRVQAALSYIELNFAVAGLTAQTVAEAQRISRRRLDQLLQDAIGRTITGQIWKRRLDQAAEDLLDPGRAHATASQIAFANGFEDVAHFTRAFRRSFGRPPLQWRNFRRSEAPPPRLPLAEPMA